MTQQVCLFWDNSNIFHSAQRFAQKKEGPAAKHSVRIQFEHLFQVARVGRKVAKAYCVGSVPPDLDRIWKRLTADTAVKPELYERGKGTGTEQGVDQCLQVWMLRCLADVSPPQVAVLLTGDGAGYSEGAGFHADLERLHNAYVKLEDHYDAVTFIEGGRSSRKPNLTTRPTSKPKA